MIIILSEIAQQRCLQDFFHQGQIPKAKICVSHCKKISPLGITDKRVAEFLNITKDRQVLASAPYALHESFFNQGANILFRISSRA